MKTNLSKRGFPRYALLQPEIRNSLKDAQMQGEARNLGFDIFWKMRIRQFSFVALQKRAVQGFT
jgi:hypothetical protein